jgi:hypothetical protein
MDAVVLPIKPIAEQAKERGEPVPVTLTAHEIREMGYVIDPRVPPWGVLCADDGSRDINLGTHPERTGYLWVYLHPQLVIEAFANMAVADPEDEAFRNVVVKAEKHECCDDNCVH